METVVSRLTVLFEDPFWIGLYERESGGSYEVAKITFGAEPRDVAVYGFLLSSHNTLRFSPPVAGERPDERRVSPKRLKRLAARQLEGAGVGTKAQQALKLQQEQGKQARRTLSREQREAERDRQFSMRQEKRRQKRRGH